VRHGFLKPVSANTMTEPPVKRGFLQERIR
jgi:hypothetical protein